VIGGNPRGAKWHPSKLTMTRLWMAEGLDQADQEALAEACDNIRSVSAGTDLQREGTPACSLHILLDGWAARYKIMKDGSRFIPAVSVPGDLCDPDALQFAKLNYSVRMLSAVTVIILPRQQARALLASHPAIANVFWTLAFSEHSIQTEWSASIGRRSALHRTAHLLCELLMRLTAIGKADGHSYDLPVTQEQLADALGLTKVHVNRMVRSLSAMEFVTVQHRRVQIHDWLGLSAMCGFQPNYLRLETIAKEFALKLPITGAHIRARSARDVPSSLSF